MITAILFMFSNLYCIQLTKRYRIIIVGNSCEIVLVDEIRHDFCEFMLKPFWKLLSFDMLVSYLWLFVPRDVSRVPNSYKIAIRRSTMMKVVCCHLSVVLRIDFVISFVWCFFFIYYKIHLHMVSIVKERFHILFICLLLSSHPLLQCGFYNWW